MKTSQFLSQTPTVVVKSTTTDTPATTKEWETTTNTVYVTETEPTTFLTTTPSPPPTTTTPTTTMDPIFQYFKKPEEASKNPVYFVIQGHSKVKTYGPSKQVHGISVQETNEIFDDDKSPYKIFILVYNNNN
ncbi:unnamed protein product [Brassicogethes aeneus]|uniref:Uncharacterized protein n=1 Tax=Brassicogethes aeneus TaxID=1431903 RepID=A0A9P0BDL5_BRAAE|nr:unnamed protein product [Brassicogethes aeneus]